jgi:DNA-binding MarR family transcriptional regulator
MPKEVTSNLKPFRLRAEGVELLRALVDRGPVSVVELRAAMGKKKAALNRMVVRMRRAGLLGGELRWVYRAPNTRRMQVLYVWITRRGEEELAEYDTQRLARSKRAAIKLTSKAVSSVFDLARV